ncbi:hypothetical protein E3N88_40033 [Mikania micrantha]|uniref:Uncharacterized protein n=1 Tax=Mikania micrantha TaxID=192012 RepID=A0A5N6LLI9_9ASTR|nr:hypothetical protein E3N88_40033 [Mikania micrantha]
MCSVAISWWEVDTEVAPETERGREAQPRVQERKNFGKMGNTGIAIGITKGLKKKLGKIEMGNRKRQRRMGSWGQSVRLDRKLMFDRKFEKSIYSVDSRLAVTLQSCIFICIIVFVVRGLTDMAIRDFVGLPAWRLQVVTAD